MNSAIHSIVNTISGIRVEVVTRKKWFSVLVYDLDAKEYVPCAKSFDQKQKAIAYARVCADCH